MITKINEFKDYIKGGLSDNKTIEDIAKLHNVGIDYVNKQIQTGIEVELEHTNDKNIAYEISKDHLIEDIEYYNKLKTIEN